MEGGQEPGSGAPVVSGETHGPTVRMAVEDDNSVGSGQRLVELWQQQRIGFDALHNEGMPMPSVAQARRIRAPYQWHHGLLDYAVPFLLDKRLDAVLEAPHEGYLYARLSHAEVATDPEVLGRVRAWYATHGMF